MDLVPVLVLAILLGQDVPAGHAPLPHEDASQDPDLGEVLSYARARMYGRSSGQVWEAMQALLRDLGFRYRELDAKNGIAVTRWKPFRTLEPRGLRASARTDGRSWVDVQYHVFVSPFVEPARVHVDAVLRSESFSGDSREVPRREYQQTQYGAAVVEAWLFDQLETRLGERGAVVPLSLERRRQRGRELADPSLSPCTPSNAKASEMQVPVNLFESEPIYPAHDRYRGAQVVVAATILDDGAIGLMSVTRSTMPGTEFEAAALGATLIRRYRPARWFGCPIDAYTTITVDYRP